LEKQKTKKIKVNQLINKKTIKFFFYTEKTKKQLVWSYDSGVTAKASKSIVEKERRKRLSIIDSRSIITNPNATKLTHNNHNLQK
jgi:hypothetical protein